MALETPSMNIDPKKSTQTSSFLSFFKQADIRLAFLFGALFICSFIWLDLPLARKLQALSSPHYTFFLQLLSQIISPIYPFIFSLVILTLYLLKVKLAKKPILIEIAVTQLISLGVVRILKVLVSRPRPKVLWIEEIEKHRLIDLFHSFPSGHTMVAFALAATLALNYRRFSGLFFSLAFTLALTRVLLLDHYLSDLFGTAFLALILVRWVHTFLQKRPSLLD